MSNSFREGAAMGIKNKRNLAIIMLLSLVFSLIAPVTVTFAASKPKLSQSKATFLVGSEKTVLVRCSVPGKISVKSLNPYFCGVSKVKKSMTKSSPARFTLKGKCAGYSIIAIHVKLKKKIKGSKEFDLRFHAYTEDKPSPSPSASATPAPSLSPSATPSPTMTPASTKTPNPTKTPTPTRTPSPRPTSTPTPTPTPTPTLSPTPTAESGYYTVSFTHNLGSGAYVTGMPDTVRISKTGDRKYTLPSGPSAEGYYFESWIYQNDYLKSPGAVITLSKDEVIKARFRSLGAPSGPIIQYETGAQRHPEIMGVINGKRLYSYGSSLVVTDIVPSWAGHTFLGWQIWGTGTYYHAGDVISNINSDMTLYAAWDPPD